ncbi:MAG: hypothetical protein V3S98_06820 [Dehalococcoidia bacterium]
MISTRAVFSSRYAFVLLAAGLLAGLFLAMTIIGAGDTKARNHVTGLESVVVNPTEVDLVPGTRSSRTVVWVYGAGLTPGTEVSILVKDGNGVISDITSAASVFPLIANDEGAVATKWTLGRFTRRGVGNEGLQTLWLVDQSFNNLAGAPIAFCDVGGRAETAIENEDALAANPDAELQEIVVPDFCSA